MDNSKDKAILIDRPIKELDEPLNVSDLANNTSDLTPRERNAWLKWLKNLDFMKLIIVFMLSIYFTDAIANNGNSSLKEKGYSLNNGYTFCVILFF